MTSPGAGTAALTSPGEGTSGVLETGLSGSPAAAAFLARRAFNALRSLPFFGALKSRLPLNNDDDGLVASPYGEAQNRDKAVRVSTQESRQNRRSTGGKPNKRGSRPSRSAVPRVSDRPIGIDTNPEDGVSLGSQPRDLVPIPTSAPTCACFIHNWPIVLHWLPKFLES
jgi:hypothetical protein